MDCSFLQKRRHLSIFPGRRQPSIFDASELNFCVRDGNRWILTAINTVLRFRAQSILIP